MLLITFLLLLSLLSFLVDASFDFSTSCPSQGCDLHTRIPHVFQPFPAPKGLRATVEFSVAYTPKGGLRRKVDGTGFGPARNQELGRWKRIPMSR